MKTTNYTVCLLKDSISSFGKALDSKKTVTPHDLDPSSGLVGTLFVGQQKQSIPPWVNLLNPYLQNPVSVAFIASISALLLVRYNNRIFGICFGHGQNLLDPFCWERHFGLKVALNRIDPLKLRSIDTKTYEDRVVTTRRQMSKGSDVGSFQLDIARALMRGVTGQSKDTTFFKRLTGADSIHFSTELKFEDLGDLLDELLVAYQDKTYKDNFEWIDNIKEVDPASRQVLDDLLVAAIRNADIEAMHLAPADIVDWDKIEGFNFPGGGTALHYPELDLLNYLEVLGNDVLNLTVERLKHHKVRVRYEGAAGFEEPWTVYDCLVWEVDLAGKKCILVDGRWFEIEATFAKQVESYVGGLAATHADLPDAQNGDTEGQYNEAVAAGNPNEFALLDKQMVHAVGAASPIEFCDLFSNKRQLVHVKKRSSSATLSHLFSQGSVSCISFLQDGGVRREVRAKLKQAGKNIHRGLIPTARPTAGEFEVVFAVLAEDKGHWPPALPFFSAVNLMHHARIVENMGFKVSLQHVRQI